MESLTSSAAAAMAEPLTENKDFFGQALVHLDKAYESVKSGNLPDGVAYLVINLKEVYVELKKNYMETAQKHQEVLKELENAQSAVINLSACNSANSALLTRHDGILEHNRVAYGTNKGYSGILESRAIGG